jgi:ubiquinone/menaquinone biosynthesis C-methylase UbiE
VNVEGDGAAFIQNFVHDIFPLSYPAAQALAVHLALGSRKGGVKVLDLAAGSGVWSIALTQSAPNVEATAFDWEGVLPATRAMVERFGLQSRYTYLAGDLNSAPFGGGYDVATLGHILHSEGGANSQALLKKTFDALKPGGTVAIAEFLVNAERTGPPVGLIFAVNMLVNSENGDTYSFEEIRQWLEAAGFVNARTLDAPGPSPLVLATKA